MVRTPFARAEGEALTRSTRLIRQRGGPPAVESAPEPNPLPVETPEPVLALGGYLRTSACLAVGKKAFGSRVVGDLDTVAARESLLEAALGLEELLDEPARAVAIDLHGHKDNFAKLIEIADLDRYTERHIVLHEVTHNIQFDTIDRDISFRSIERLAEYKCEYPDRVHIVMGNHELSEYLGKKIVKDGHMLNKMFADGLKSQYGSEAGAVKQAYNIFFKSQALAVRAPNGIFFSHSVPAGKV